MNGGLIYGILQGSVLSRVLFTNVIIVLQIITKKLRFFHLSYIHNAESPHIYWLSKTKEGKGPQLS